MQLQPQNVQDLGSNTLEKYLTEERVDLCQHIKANIVPYFYKNFRNWNALTDLDLKMKMSFSKENGFSKKWENWNAVAGMK